MPPRRVSGSRTRRCRPRPLLSMASLAKLRYHRSSAVASREDTGSGRGCNELAADGGASAGGRSGRRIAGAALLCCCCSFRRLASPARAQEADPFSATVKVDAARRHRGQGARGGAARRPAPGAGGDRRTPAGRRRRGQTAKARRQGDHRPRRQFRGRERADVGGALYGRLHVSFPAGGDPAGPGRCRDRRRPRTCAKPPLRASRKVAQAAGNAASRR